MSDILFETRGGVGIATLNRPRALNALTLAMYRAFARELAEWGRDPDVHAVVLRGAGERAFCAGGDIRLIYEARGARPGPGDYKTEMFADEYRFIRDVHRFPKPYVALAHGITMGGGAGLSVNGRYRVATDSTVFAMPEVFIGSIPDVGASRFLGGCPGRIGLYLALSGARIGAADAMYCGLYTHHVPDARLDPLVEALTTLDWRRGAEDRQMRAVLDRFASPPGEAPVAALQPAIDRRFGGRSVESIVAALAEEPAGWAKSALDALGRASPTSLKIVFEQLRRGAGLELEEALILEYRIIQHILGGEDFYEGVRSVVVDKDRRPSWRPATLAEVHDDEVEAYFHPLANAELRLD